MSLNSNLGPKIKKKFNQNDTSNCSRIQRSEKSLKMKVQLDQRIFQNFDLPY